MIEYQDHRWAIGKVLLHGPRGALFLMSEVPTPRSVRLWLLIDSRSCAENINAHKGMRCLDGSQTEVSTPTLLHKNSKNDNGDSDGGGGWTP